MAAVSIMSTIKDPNLPLSMTMMGGPIDTRHSPTEVNKLATKHSFEKFRNTVIMTVPAKYAGAGRRVYPGFLQHAGFVAMNPDRHSTAHWDHYLNLVRGDLEDIEQHRKFYDEYNAVLDLPAEYYLDTIKVVFQEHQLPRGLVEGKFRRSIDRRAARGYPGHCLVHDRRRTRRYFGFRANTGRARAVLKYSRQNTSSI